MLSVECTINIGIMSENTETINKTDAERGKMTGDLITKKTSNKGKRHKEEKMMICQEEHYEKTSFEKDSETEYLDEMTSPKNECRCSENVISEQDEELPRNTEEDIVCILESGGKGNNYENAECCALQEKCVECLTNHDNKELATRQTIDQSTEDNFIRTLSQQQVNVSDMLNQQVVTENQETTRLQSRDNLVESATSLRYTSQSICRICHCGSAEEKLLTPCKCRGTTRFVHASCLVGWFAKKRNKTCEICLYEVKIERRGLKPFSKWTFPRRSCDFIGFLFAFYGVILLIFVIMILRIASNGCQSTVCVVLYFVSIISLVYFSYCCGFVEQTKRCWRTYLDLNRKVVIENRQDSSNSVSFV